MKSKNHLTYLAMVLVIACALPTETHAGDLLIGTGVGYPPYYFVKNNKSTGLCVEVINRTAHSLGMGVIYKHYPWKRMLYSGKVGLVDAVMPLFKTPERE